MRQQIQQSKNAIAELVAKLQEEQAKLERMEARAEKYEEAIAFLHEAIAEDHLLWGEVRDRLQPSSINSSEAGYQISIGDIRYVEALEATLATDAALSIINGAIPGLLDSPMSDPQQQSPTIIWDGSGVARLGCAKQKLAKEWKDLLTLWGCTAEVIKAESFSDKEIKWEVAIANITRSQLETLAKTHTSPHAEVPTPGRKVERDADIERECLQSPSSEQIFDAECLPVEALASTGDDKDLPSFILGYLESVGSSDFADICQARGLEFCDDDEIANTLESLKAEGRIFEISEDPWLWSVRPVSVTLGEVLEGASPLDLNDEQIDELEQALASSPPPSIDDAASPAPSAYAEEMALKIKPGTKLRSLPFPRDPKHKSSRKRTGIVRQIEREGAYIYAFVAELTESGTNTRHTAHYNLEAVEILEDAPAIVLEIGTEEPATKNDFDYFEPSDSIEITLQSDGVLAGLEAEIFQFLTEKAAQADLYEGNDPSASFSEICAAIKLDFVEYDRPLTALENLESRGLILGTGILGKEGRDRWQIAPEKPSQDHSFKVGDRVTISGDSKGEDLVGKVGTLTAVSLNGCVLYLDGEDEKNRLFFCKEDLSPCFTFSQTA